MGELLFSFLAGVLTAAAPCVLPVLPIIVGGSIADQEKRDKVGPLFIALGLGLSIIVFTLILKASTSLLGVPQQVWQVISGVIVLLFGIHFLFPGIWERLSGGGTLQDASNHLLQSAGEKRGRWGQFLMGAALGPVFNSCSPTYALIVAAVLPVTFGLGLSYLLAYVLGLCLILLLVAYLGRSIVARLRGVADPRGRVRKVIGILFILVALMILTGLDKKVQAYVLEQGWYAPIAEVEVDLHL
jgi:cytochrome c-type biogenesis protein